MYICFNYLHVAYHESYVKLVTGKYSYRLHNINNNIRTFFDLKISNSPSKLRFEANLSTEDSPSTKHNQKSRKISYNTF